MINTVVYGQYKGTYTMDFEQPSTWTARLTFANIEGHTITHTIAAYSQSEIIEKMYNAWSDFVRAGVVNMQHKEPSNG